MSEPAEVTKTGGRDATTRHIPPTLALAVGIPSTPAPNGWRAILEYFAPAVQLGLTATPKRQDNVDTYRYFGDPVFIYSLKDGINDGFLTPFRVRQIQTTLDYYVYTSDDTVVEGEIEAGKLYEEEDFNKIIEIKEREAHRVKLFMEMIDQREKTLVFCANQAHALAVRDLINQMKTSTDPNYCHRVTADDGAVVRRQGLLHDLRLCASPPSFPRSGVGRGTGTGRGVLEMRSAPVRVRSATGQGVRALRSAAVRVRERSLSQVWQGAVRVSEAGESEVGGREGTDDPAHDDDDVLASGRDADQCGAVPGDAVRAAAGVFPARGAGGCGESGIESEQRNRWENCRFLSKIGEGGLYSPANKPDRNCRQCRFSLHRPCISRRCRA
jgi:hypothetical protein